MKNETAGNAFIGLGGTTIAWFSSTSAAALAGYATAAWMLWQLGAAIYDRVKRK